jgi:hypothetical protein
VPLHRRHVEVRAAIAVRVEGRGFARPGGVYEAGFLRGVLEPAVTEVVEEERRLGSIGVEVPGKGVAHGGVQAVPSFVTGVLADIGHEQVEQAVAVVVEEHDAGRVRAEAADAGARRDVGERAVPSF